MLDEEIDCPRDRDLQVPNQHREGEFLGGVGFAGGVVFAEFPVKVVFAEFPGGTSAVNGRQEFGLQKG